MATYATMQARIADELARTDLTSQIQTAILDSILYYERFRWAWNENTFTFSTVISQQAYGAVANANIPNIVAFDSVMVTPVSGAMVRLTQRSKAMFDILTTTTATTADPPTDFTYNNLQLLLFPSPSAVRVVTITGIVRLAALAVGSDTNAWTTDGEQLIRTAAKIQLLETVIRSQASMEEAQMLRQTKLAQLEGDIAGENARRISVGLRRFDDMARASPKLDSVSPYGERGDQPRPPL